MTSHLAHVREIEAVCDGRNLRRDPVVVESWQRCVARHRLDPAKQGEAYIVPETRLREHRQQSEDLIRIARSGIERLYALLAGQNYVLLLADHHGVTVEYLGDELQKAELRQSGLYLGSEWSEARAGTCALGACIESGEALVIHQDDHFDAAHTGLSCTAAPIRDSRGRLRAVLDVSLLTSPKPKTSQHLALNLVRSAARRIELANLMAQSRNDWVLRLASSPEFLDVDPEAALAFDAAGRITGLTDAAARILCAADGLAAGQAEALIDRPVTDFFELALGDLDQLTRARPPQDRLIRARDGQAMFAHAIEPQPQRPARSLRSTGMPTPLGRLAGHDPVMSDLLERAARLAPSGCPILLAGETGTGKETLARAIHEVSGRRGRLVILDCADLPDERIEETLFGRVGRTGRSTGMLAAADGGTLLLDEVAELPLRVQSRLLRLLAEGSFVPLGGAVPVVIDIRVIATTQHALSERVAAGAFRKDLFYRLGAAVLSLPALRERRDLGWLLQQILARHPGAEVTDEARQLLCAHDWPGNIRELGHVLAAAAALAGNRPIAPRHLPGNLDGQARLLGAVDTPTVAQPIEAVLAACNGNVSAAARALGVNRSTIYRRMRPQRPD
ncbi:sigma-54-dependent Fis family transcriptional regulator [Tropicimonas sp. IMCC34043]|uniref:sigma-54-dependent Fis family transcriptional regulator n=1 Tax=Tropicimonas sp. IMCC34043 TaxID=2248760 RepID=UPI000E26C667|nr:sigma-54-dependent Fis family transcriptional regulator [Tropicimonas sp. IMCC34043]